MKFCKKCSTEKPLSDFHANRECRDGRESTCKVCKRDKRRSLRVPKPPRWPVLDPNATVKQCKKCRTEKLFVEFYDKKDSRDGLHPHCKVCVNEYMRSRDGNPEVLRKRKLRYSRRKDDPDFIADAKRRAAKHYGSIEGRAKSLLRNAQKSPDGCALSLDHVMRGIERGYCIVTGIPFDMTIDQLSRTGRHTNPFAPSLDRTNPHLGYTDENVRVVIWQYNLMKGEISDAEVLTIARTLVSRYAA